MSIFISINVNIIFSWNPPLWNVSKEYIIWAFSLPAHFLDCINLLVLACSPLYVWWTFFVSCHLFNKGSNWYEGDNPVVITTLVNVLEEWSGKLTISILSLQGVGFPLDIVVCSALGADMYDCVYPTRTARFGTALVPEVWFREGKIWLSWS